MVGGSWGSGPWFLVWGRVCGWFMCASAFDSACQTGSKEKTRLIRILIHLFLRNYFYRLYGENLLLIVVLPLLRCHNNMFVI